MTFGPGKGSFTQSVAKGKPTKETNMRTVTRFEVGDWVKITQDWRDWQKDEIAKVVKVSPGDEYGDTVMLESISRPNDKKDFSAMYIQFFRIYINASDLQEIDKKVEAYRKQLMTELVQKGITQ